MERDDDAVCGEIKIAVPFVMSRVAKENTRHGARCELVGSYGGQVGITSATEHMKVGVIRR